MAPKLWLPAPAPVRKDFKKRGLGAKTNVWAGKELETRGGLKAADMHKNKFGAVVSKKVSVASSSRYEGSNLQKWNLCMKDARQILGFEGRFVKVGQGADGEALRALTKDLMQERHGQ